VQEFLRSPPFHPDIRSHKTAFLQFFAEEGELGTEKDAQMHPFGVGG
jgi:hypothetical protein